MPPDDCISAMVFPEFQEFREEAGREEAGISPDAVMGKSGNLIRLTAPEFHQRRNGFPPEKRLVTDEEKHAVAVPEVVQSQGDGMADSPIRMLVQNGRKTEFRRQLKDLRVLGDDGDTMEAFCRDGVQGAGNQALTVQHRGQLVLTESGRIPRRHDHTADLQLIHDKVSIKKNFAGR